MNILSVRITCESAVIDGVNLNETVGLVILRELGRISRGVYELVRTGPTEYSVLGADDAAVGVVSVEEVAA